MKVKNLFRDKSHDKSIVSGEHPAEDKKQRKNKFNIRPKDLNRERNRLLELYRQKRNKDTKDISEDNIRGTIHFEKNMQFQKKTILSLVRKKIGNSASIETKNAGEVEQYPRISSFIVSLKKVQETEEEKRVSIGELSTIPVSEVFNGFDKADSLQEIIDDDEMHFGSLENKNDIKRDRQQLPKMSSFILSLRKVQETEEEKRFSFGDISTIPVSECCNEVQQRDSIHEIIEADELDWEAAISKNGGIEIDLQQYPRISSFILSKMQEAEEERHFSIGDLSMIPIAEDYAKIEKKEPLPDMFDSAEFRMVDGIIVLKQSPGKQPEQKQDLIYLDLL